MTRKIIIVFGALMLTVGLLGFFMPNILFLVQFDLVQSFIYCVFGSIGLKLGLDAKTSLIEKNRYLVWLAMVNLSLLTIGIFWPNLGDIMHLEMPEHIFHGTIGLVAALTADWSRRQTTQ